MPTPVVTGSVTLAKPFYLSKKVYVSLIAFAVALYSAYTGKDLSADQIAAHIASTATLLAPLLTLVLAIAHVDGKERDLIGAILSTAEDLGKPGELVTQAAPATVTTTAIDPPKPFDVPGLK